MSVDPGVSATSASAPQLRLTTSQRWILGVVSFVATSCAILSRWLLTTQVGAPSQQGMAGVILGAVAVFLPTFWLLFFSPFSAAVRLLGPAAICAITATFLQIGDATETALSNILTTAFGAIALVCFLVWLLLFASSKSHWKVLVGVALAVALFFVFFRLEEPTGDMVPRIRPRFSKRPDQLLEKLTSQPSAADVDLSKTTEYDFPRFLGTNADGRVTTPLVLDTDWENHPPKLLWKRPIGAGWSAFAIVGDYAVTLEQRDTEELISCYEVKTGKPTWSHAIEARHETTLGGIGPRSTPTIHNGRVYALGATGVLRCLDGQTGKLIWSHDLLSEHGIAPDVEAGNIAWGRAASPLIVDDMVVVPLGGPDAEHCTSLIAFHPETGDVIWQGGKSQVSYCSPQLVTLDGVRQILIVNEASVAGHDIITGEQLWEFPWMGASNSAATNSQAHIVGDDLVLISKGYSTGAAVFKVHHNGDTWSVAEEPVWKNSRALKTKFTNVVVDEAGNVFGLSEGRLQCVDSKTGELRWQARGTRYGHGQVLLVNDLLLVLGEAGELVIGKANADAWEELGRIQALEGKTWNNLALSGNRLLVRNAEEAACYELPTK